MLPLPQKGPFWKELSKQGSVSQLIDFLVKTTRFDPDKDDVEFIFSLDDEPNIATLIALKIEKAQDIFKVSPAEQPRHLIPLALIHIYPDKWSKPIMAIASFDIGAHQFIINPNVLLKECWMTHEEYFKAADN